MNLKTSLKAAIFDFDGVLCDYQREALAAHLGRAVGRTAAAVYDAIWGRDLDARSDAGIISSSEFLIEVGDQLGARLTTESWIGARIAATNANDAVISIAASLAAVCPIYVLTNNNDLIVDHMSKICPPVARLFSNNIYASARFGAAKPDPTVFLRCLEYIERAPEDVLFVDDLYANVASARSLQIRSVLFENAEGLLSAIAESVKLA
ncbi:HAD family hydrolase [Robbsia andropogonis]|uniref:HAD family hydrolase n=1 Tax=Robbsia andropogonis TaxID=28092 RepID=UPI0004638238|nr:HAD family phosphatase [Robbsia andropogonis]